MNFKDRFKLVQRTFKTTSKKTLVYKRIQIAQSIKVKITLEKSCLNFNTDNFQLEDCQIISNFFKKELLKTTKFE